MPGPPSSVLHILGDLGCLKPQVTKFRINPVKAVLKGCQVLQKTGLGSVGSFAGRRGEGKKERKESKNKKNNVTLFIDYSLFFKLKVKTEP